MSRPRLGDLAAAEWIKYRSLRSSYAVLASMAWLAAAGSAIGVWHLNLSPYGMSTYIPLRECFNDGVWAGLMLGAGCVGAMFLVGEFSSGLFRTTLLAVPERRQVIAAKALTAMATMAVFGVLLSIATIAASTVTMADEYRVHPLRIGPAFAAVGGHTLMLVVCAAIGLAIASIVRHPAASLLVTWGALAKMPAPGHAWGFAVIVGCLGIAVLATDRRDV